MSIKLAHIPELPKWMDILRFVQVLLAVVVLGISAYGISLLSVAAWVLALCTSLVGMVIFAYNILAPRIPSLHEFYNFWVILGLDFLGAILWLASMAALAARRGNLSYASWSFFGCFNLGSCTFDSRSTYLDLMSATAGISGVLMVLFFGSLIFVAFRLRSHRAAGVSMALPTAEKPEDRAHSIGAVPPQFQQQPVYAHVMPEMPDTSQYFAPQGYVEAPSSPVRPQRTPTVVVEVSGESAVPRRT